MYIFHRYTKIIYLYKLYNLVNLDGNYIQIMKYNFDHPYNYK